MRHCSDSYYYYSCTRDTESSNVAATLSRTTLLTPGLVYRQLLSPHSSPQSCFIRVCLSLPRFLHARRCHSGVLCGDSEEEEDGQ